MFQLDGEQKKLQARARELAQGAIAGRAAEVDRTEQYPWDNVALLREAGFMGMTIPRQWGGQGRSWLDAVLLIEQMAQVCGVTGRIAVEANMGAIGAIMAYGSDAQRRLAADLVLGGDKPAICITEPGAGSAASEMTTRAERHGDTWVLNGRKHWITGAGVSRLHLIFARVLEGGVSKGIGGFIAVRDESKGLRIGKRTPTMGLRGIPEAEVICEDLEVPHDMVLVPPGGFGRGFAELMDAYNGQRVGAATVALGLAEGAYALALDYSRTREQFGRPICEFQGLQWMLADMSVAIAASRALVYGAAGAGGTAFPDPLEAAQAKILAAENAIKVVNDALQVFGAAGYSRELPLERMARDVRMFTIGGGTAQILRTLVASRILGRKLPQTRDGYLDARLGDNSRRAAE
jgi:alkylation response protein AidB-like acyl-CoA dehydrogenase